MSWPDREHYLCSLQSLVVSRIHSTLFSDWRHTVSSKFFDTKTPSISTEELVLLCHTRCVLFCLHCNRHSLLSSSYLSLSLLSYRISNFLCLMEAVVVVLKMVNFINVMAKNLRLFKLLTQEMKAQPVCLLFYSKV